MRISEKEWKTIVEYFGGQKHIAMIGSVNNEGQPNVTPVGSLVLREDLTGYYYDLFTQGLSDNLDRNNNVCVLFAESGSFYWFKALCANKCSKPAGIKLIGSAGDRRKANAEEIKLLRNRTKSLKMLKGYNSIFGNPSFVRDIVFTDYYNINIGKMTFKI